MNSGISAIEEHKIFNLLKNTDGDIYLVGGAVRDILMGKKKISEIYDLDIIVTDRPAKEFAEEFGKNNDVATVITLDDVNNIYRVVMADKVNYIDITNPINNSLKDDINRRDITINAIAYNIKTSELVDLVGGVNDIEKGVIRAVSENNFVDDPLRMIRVFRFASTTGFEIEPDTRKFIDKHKGLILKPAVERRNCEILKLFGGKYADRIIEEIIWG